MRLYKYLSSQYLDKVLNEGEFLFRSLSYFQDYDDNHRGDKNEGVLRYSGKNGLEINNLTTGQSFRISGTFTSKVVSNKIFIFSLSKKLCPILAKEFGADICIEFKDYEVIIDMLNKTIEPNKILHGKVKYYTKDEEASIDWALPESIIMKKLKDYSRQEEYRFIFALDNALEVYNTNQSLELKSISSRTDKQENYPEQSLKIGNIKKYCTIHRF